MEFQLTPFCGQSRGDYQTRSRMLARRALEKKKKYEIGETLTLRLMFFGAIQEVGVEVVEGAVIIGDVVILGLKEGRLFQPVE